MAHPLVADSLSWTGFLDKTLAIFEQNNQPFILVGMLAKWWSGCRHDPGPEIDVLYPKPDEIVDPRNTSETPRTWLKYRHEHILFRYLVLWPEELYHLSLDCEKFEVPDVFTKGPMLIEEEYDRDPYDRFKLPTQSRRKESELLPALHLRAKSDSQKVPIYIPSIKALVNALLRQRVTELMTKRPNGGDPRGQLRDLIRYLVLDWEPTRQWFLDTKIEPSLRATMESVFEGFTRKQIALWDDELGKSVFGKIPWELSIKNTH